MAPLLPLMALATPVLPLPATVLPAQLMVLAVPSVQSVASALTRNDVKLAVVPDESDRCTTVIAVLGSPLLPSAAMAGSFQVVILREKILAIVGAESFRLLTPDRLYDTVIGPRTVGK